MGLKDYGFGNMEKTEKMEKMEKMMEMMDFLHDLKNNLTEETHKCSKPHETLELFRAKHPDLLKGKWTGWHWRDKTTKIALKNPQHFCIYCMKDLPGS